MDSDGREVGKALGGVRGDKTLIRMYYMKKNPSERQEKIKRKKTK